MDCSLLVSFVQGIFQARTLEWVAISYSRGSSPPSDLTWISCVSCIGRWILYHWAIDWILVGLLVFCFYKECYNRQLHCIFWAQVWMNLGVSQVKNVNGKESACQCRRLKRCRLGRLVGKIPWSWKWQPTPVFLPGKFHGEKPGSSSPWGRKESDMTKHACTHTHTTHTGFLGGAVVKNLPAHTGDARDVDSISGSGWSPGIGNGNPLQYSCLENSSQRSLAGYTQESDSTEHTWMHAHTHTHTYPHT